MAPIVNIGCYAGGTSPTVTLPALSHSIDQVEDLADAIRQSMLTEYKTDKITHMKPVGAIPAIQTREGRFIFTVAFQTIISR
jgi:hypothetical protein